MRGLYLLSVWLHILAASVWIGGIVFLIVVLVPVSRKPDYRNVASSLIQGTGIRFRMVGWICLSVLILSGSFNLYYRGLGLAGFFRGLSGGGSFGTVLTIKLLLVSIILLISAIHDFLIGPQAMRLWQSDPASPEALRLRKLASLIGRANLILALLAVALGIVLVRGGL